MSDAVGKDLGNITAGASKPDPAKGTPANGTPPARQVPAPATPTVGPNIEASFAVQGLRVDGKRTDPAGNTTYWTNDGAYIYRRDGTIEHNALHSYVQTVPDGSTIDGSAGKPGRALPSGTQVKTFVHVDTVSRVDPVSGQLTHVVNDTSESLISEAPQSGVFTPRGSAGLHEQVQGEAFPGAPSKANNTPRGDFFTADDYRIGANVGGFQPGAPTVGNVAPGPDGKPHLPTIARSPGLAGLPDDRVVSPTGYGTANTGSAAEDATHTVNVANHLTGITQGDPRGDGFGGGPNLKRPDTKIAGEINPAGFANRGDVFGSPSVVGFMDPATKNPYVAADNQSRIQQLQRDAGQLQSARNAVVQTFNEPNKNAAARAITGGRQLPKEQVELTNSFSEQTVATGRGATGKLMVGYQTAVQASGDPHAPQVGRSVDGWLNNPNNHDAARAVDDAAGSVINGDGKLAGLQPAYTGSQDTQTALKIAGRRIDYNAYLQTGQYANYLRYNLETGGPGGAPIDPDQRALMALQYTPEQAVTASIARRDVLNNGPQDWAGPAGINTIGAAYGFKPDAKPGPDGVMFSGDALAQIKTIQDRALGYGPGSNIAVMPTLVGSDDGQTTPSAFLKVTDAHGQVQLIDDQGHHFNNIDDYKLSGDMLPGLKIITPNENLSRGPDGGLVLSQTDAHRTTFMGKAAKVADIAVPVAMVVGGAALTATGAGAGAGVLLMAGGFAYGGGRAIAQGIDRRQHGKTMDFRDPGARSVYVGALTSAAGFLRAGAALGEINNIYQASKVTKAALSTLVVAGIADQSIEGVNNLRNNWDPRGMTTGERNYQIASLASTALLLGAPKVLNRAAASTPAAKATQAARVNAAQTRFDRMQADLQAQKTANTGGTGAPATPIVVRGLELPGEPQRPAAPGAVVLNVTPPTGYTGPSGPPQSSPGTSGPGTTGEANKPARPALSVLPGGRSTTLPPAQGPTTKPAGVVRTVINKLGTVAAGLTIAMATHNYPLPGYAPEAPPAKVVTAAAGSPSAGDPSMLPRPRAPTTPAGNSAPADIPTVQDRMQPVSVQHPLTGGPGSLLVPMANSNGSTPAERMTSPLAPVVDLPNSTPHSAPTPTAEHATLEQPPALAVAPHSDQHPLGGPTTDSPAARGDAVGGVPAPHQPAPQTGTEGSKPGMTGPSTVISNREQTQPGTRGADDALFLADPVAAPASTLHTAGYPDAEPVFTPVGVLSAPAPDRGVDGGQPGRQLADAAPDPAGGGRGAVPPGSAGPVIAARLVADGGQGNASGTDRNNPARRSEAAAAPTRGTPLGLTAGLDVPAGDRRTTGEDHAGSTPAGSAGYAPTPAVAGLLPGLIAMFAPELQADTPSGSSEGIATGTAPAFVQPGEGSPLAPPRAPTSLTDWLVYDRRLDPDPRDAGPGGERGAGYRVSGFPFGLGEIFLFPLMPLVMLMAPIAQLAQQTSTWHQGRQKTRAWESALQDLRTLMASGAGEPTIQQAEFREAQRRYDLQRWSDGVDWRKHHDKYWDLVRVLALAQSVHGNDSPQARAALAEVIGARHTLDQLESRRQLRLLTHEQLQLRARLVGAVDDRDINQRLELLDAATAAVEARQSVLDAQTALDRHTVTTPGEQPGEQWNQLWDQLNQAWQHYQDTVLDHEQIRIQTRLDNLELRENALSAKLKTINDNASAMLDIRGELAMLAAEWQALTDYDKFLRADRDLNRLHGQLGGLARHPTVQYTLQLLRQQINEGLAHTASDAGLYITALEQATKPDDYNPGSTFGQLRELQHSNGTTHLVPGDPIRQAELVGQLQQLHQQIQLLTLDRALANAQKRVHDLQKRIQRGSAEIQNATPNGGTGTEVSITAMFDTWSEVLELEGLLTTARQHLDNLTAKRLRIAAKSGTTNLPPPGLHTTLTDLQTALIAPLLITLVNHTIQMVRQHSNMLTSDRRSSGPDPLIGNPTVSNTVPDPLYGPAADLNAHLDTLTQLFELLHQLTAALPDDHDIRTGIALAKQLTLGDQARRDEAVNVLSAVSALGTDSLTASGTAANDPNETQATAVAKRPAKLGRDLYRPRFAAGLVLAGAGAVGVLATASGVLTPVTAGVMAVAASAAGLVHALRRARAPPWLKQLVAIAALVVTLGMASAPAAIAADGAAHTPAVPPVTSPAAAAAHSKSALHAGMPTVVVPGSVTEVTGQTFDTAGVIASFLGVSYETLSATPGNHFTGPEQSVAGLKIHIPAGWDGTVTAIGGDSVWRMTYDRLGLPAEYRRTVDQLRTEGRNPALIYVGETFRVQPSSPKEPPTAPTHDDSGAVRAEITLAGAVTAAQRAVATADGAAAALEQAATVVGKANGYRAWAPAVQAREAALAAAQQAADHAQRRITDAQHQLGAARAAGVPPQRVTAAERQFQDAAAQLNDVQTRINGIATQWVEPYWLQVAVMIALTAGLTAAVVWRHTLNKLTAAGRAEVAGRDARVSARWVALVSILFSVGWQIDPLLPQPIFGLVPWAVLIVAGFVGQLVQKKDARAVRVVKGAVAAFVNIVAADVLRRVGVLTVPAGWGSWLAGLAVFVVALSVASPLGDYLVDGLSRAVSLLMRGKRDKVRQQAEIHSAVLSEPANGSPDPSRRGGHRPVTRLTIGWVHWWAKAEDMFTVFRRASLPVVLAKGLDPVVVTLLVYLAVRPAPGLPDTPLVMGLHVALALAFYPVTVVFRDRLERWRDIVGYRDPRTVRAPGRRGRPIGLVGGRLVFGRVVVRVARAERRHSQWLKRVDLDENASAQDEAAAHIEQIVALSNRPPPRELQQRQPGTDPLETQRAAARDTWESVWAGNARAAGLSTLRLAKDVDPLLFEAGGRREAAKWAWWTGRRDRLNRRAALIERQIEVQMALAESDGWQALGLQASTALSLAELKVELEIVLKDGRKVLKGHLTTLDELRTAEKDLLDDRDGADQQRLNAEYVLAVTNWDVARAQRLRDFDPDGLATAGGWLAALERRVQIRIAVSKALQHQGAEKDELKIAANLALLAGYANVTDEIGVGPWRAHLRSRWGPRVRAAVRPTTPALSPFAPLRVMFALVDLGLDRPVTAHEVAERLAPSTQGATEAVATQLTELASLQAVDRINSAEPAKYLLAEMLRPLLARAPPRVRSALLTNPSALRARFEPLTEPLPRLDGDPAVALEALIEWLRTAGRALGDRRPYQLDPRDAVTSATEPGQPVDPNTDDPQT